MKEVEKNCNISSAQRQAMGLNSNTSLQIIQH